MLTVGLTIDVTEVSCFASATFHNFTVPSEDADASNVPSAENDYRPDRICMSLARSGDSAASVSTSHSTTLPYVYIFVPYLQHRTICVIRESCAIG